MSRQKKGKIASLFLLLQIIFSLFLPLQPLANIAFAVNTDSIEITLNDDTATHTGAWINDSTCATNAINQDGHFADNATWNLNVPNDGNYLMTAYWVFSQGNTTQAIYQVVDDANTLIFTSSGINQKGNNNDRCTSSSTNLNDGNLLSLKKDKTYKVILSGESNKYAYADAIKFSSTDFTPIVTDITPPNATYDHYVKGILFDGAIAHVKSINDLSFNASYTDDLPSSGLLKDSFVIFDAQADGSFAFSQNGAQAYCGWNALENTLPIASGILNAIDFNKCAANLDNGEYYLAHQVYDNVSFRDVISLHFFIDQTKPIINAILSPNIPDGNNGWYKNNPEITLVPENIDEIASIEYKWNEEGWSPYISPLILAIEGTHTLRYRAFDKAGNESDLGNLNLKLDRTIPILHDKTIFSGWNRNNQISEFNFTDAISGIVSGSPATCLISTEGNNQTCKVTPNVCDEAGNCFTDEIISNDVNIDKTNPITNASLDWQNSKPVITLSADDLNGIAKIEYKWDEIGSWNQYSEPFSPITFGNYTIYYHSIDIAGNESEIGTLNFKWEEADITAPAIPDLPSPTDLSHVNIHDFTFSWSEVTDPSSPITYEWEASDDTATNLDGSFASRLAYHQLSSPLVYSPGTPDNTYYWHVRATDAANNASAWSSTWKVTVDTSIPTPTTKTIFLNSWYNNEQISNFSFTDSTSENLTGLPVSCSINTEGSTQTCSVIPDVCDQAGNCYTSELFSNPINIDTTKPESIITSPINTESGSIIYTNEWDGLITGTATDNLSGLDTIYLSIERTSDNTFWNGESWVIGTEDSIRVMADGRENWSYNLQPQAEGTYRIISHALDNANNLENSYKLTIIFDKTIPDVNISVDPSIPDGQNGWYTTKPTITLNSNDDELTNHIEYQWESKTGIWETYLDPIQPSSEGNHILYYRAIDKAGNESLVGAKNLAWDQTELTNGPLKVDATPNLSNGPEAKVTWEAATDNIAIDHYRVTWTLINGNVSFSENVVANIRELKTDQLKDVGIWRATVTAYDGAGHGKYNYDEITIEKAATTTSSTSTTDSNSSSSSTETTTQTSTPGTIITPTPTITRTAVIQNPVQTPEVLGTNTEEPALEQKTVVTPVIDNQKGSVLGDKTSACNSLVNNAWWALLLAQLLALLVAEYKLGKKHKWLKVALYALLTIAPIILVYYFVKQACFGNAATLWVLRHYYLAAFASAMLAKMFSYMMIEEEA